MAWAAKWLAPGTTACAGRAAAPSCARIPARRPPVRPRPGCWTAGSRNDGGGELLARGHHLAQVAGPTGRCRGDAGPDLRHRLLAAARCVVAALPDRQWWSGTASRRSAAATRAASQMIQPVSCRTPCSVAAPGRPADCRMLARLRHGVLGRAAALWRPLPGRAVPSMGSGGVPVHLTITRNWAVGQAKSWRKVGVDSPTLAEWGVRESVGAIKVFRPLCAQRCQRAAASRLPWVDRALGVELGGHVGAADQVRVLPAARRVHRPARGAAPGRRRPPRGRRAGVCSAAVDPDVQAGVVDAQVLDAAQHLAPALALSVARWIQPVVLPRRAPGLAGRCAAAARPCRAGGFRLRRASGRRGVDVPRVHAPFGGPACRVERRRGACVRQELGDVETDAAGADDRHPCAGTTRPVSTSR